MEDQHLFTNRIDQISFWFISFNLALASYLLVYFPAILIRFLDEDSLAENCGALFFLLTGCILVKSSYDMYKKGKADGNFIRWRFFMVLGAGILFLFAFGEEISWGQRLFNIKTPEALNALNRQGEINIHNLDTRLFNNAVETAVLLMILIPTIWMHRGKDRLFGFLLPSYWLILNLQLAASYVSYNYVKTQDYITYLVLAYFLFMQAKSKQWGKLFYVVTAIGIISVVGVLNVHFRESFPKNGLREFREYLYAFICLIYSLKIYLDIRKPG